MKRHKKYTTTVAILALLAACGGGGDGGNGRSVIAPPISDPPPVTVAACSLRARQDFALAQLREFYLYPDLLDTSVNPAQASSLQGNANSRSGGRSRQSVIS